VHFYRNVLSVVPSKHMRTLVDVTLRRTQIKDNFEFAASVHNLFDADSREPSLSPGLIPDDLPLAGRNFYLELRYHQ